MFVRRVIASLNFPGWFHVSNDRARDDIGCRFQIQCVITAVGFVTGCGKV
jgi:hypothetical protein